MSQRASCVVLLERQLLTTASQLQRRLPSYIFRVMLARTGSLFANSSTRVRVSYWPTWRATRDLRLFHRGTTLRSRLGTLWRSNGNYAGASAAVRDALLQEHFS